MSTTNKIVAYLGSWSYYRQSKGKFTIEDIDPKLCTHLIYAFVGINEDGSIKIMDQWLDIDLGNMKKFNQLKNSNLKTLVAIGGWNEGSEKYSHVAGNPQLRKTFVRSTVDFLKTHGFDGFDIDWEYPTQRGGSPQDKQNFGFLVKEMRAEFDRHSPPYLLTAAVAATQARIDLSYDVPTISKHLNFINVMTYDLHGSWENKTGHNAPMYPSSSDVSPEQKQLNVDACVKAWINAGAPAEKLILGMGTYGRTFTLAGPDHGVGAPTNGSGQAGPYTNEAGMLGYYEICEDKGWTEVWSDQQQVPYAYKGNQWVGYDNPRSITIKVDYAKKMGLGGVMIWSIETDDFHGNCGPKYPILGAINRAIRN